MRTLRLPLIAAAGLMLAGCGSVSENVRKIPVIGFKSWSHSDRYGPFTDSFVLSGSKWQVNADGSATLWLQHYDGNAAWLGMVGPHDVIEELVVQFAPDSPQAAALRAQAATAPFQPAGSLLKP